MGNFGLLIEEEKNWFGIEPYQEHRLCDGVSGRYVLDERTYYEGHEDYDSFAMIMESIDMTQTRDMMY